MRCVVKRDGSLRPYDEKKIFQAAFEACVDAHVGRKEAAEVARAVAQEVKRRIVWVEVVKSDVLFHETIVALKKRSEDAAFMYATHRDIS